MLARKDRVPEEPRQGEDRVVVRVRHLTFGVVERAFRPDTMLASIYDWVGSLDSTPEHFVLSNYNNDLIPTECIGTIAIHSSIVLMMMSISEALGASLMTWTVLCPSVLFLPVNMYIYLAN